MVTIALVEKSLGKEFFHRRSITNFHGGERARKIEKGTRNRGHSGATRKKRGGEGKKKCPHKQGRSGNFMGFYSGGDGTRGLEKKKGQWGQWESTGAREKEQTQKKKKKGEITKKNWGKPSPPIQISGYWTRKIRKNKGNVHCTIVASERYERGGGGEVGCYAVARREGGGSRLNLIPPSNQEIKTSISESP